MNVMFLCAGLGTRLRPYTLTTAKPLIPFLGVPMANYSLALLEEISIDNLVVNLHHLPEQVEFFFKDLKPPCKELIFSNEREKILGSGGGIHLAQEFLDNQNDFLVLNGDEVLLSEDPYLMKKFIDFHHSQNALATLLTIKHPGVGAQFGGAWCKEPPLVHSFSKKPVSGCEGFHFTGYMLFSSRVFQYFKSGFEEENILYETLTKAMALGEKVCVYNTKASWFETGDPHGFIEATKTCMQNPTENLIQTIHLYGGSEPIIEKDFPEVLSSLNQFFEKYNLISE